MHSAAFGSGQSQVFIKLGEDLLESSPAEKDLGVPDGQEAGHEPTERACRLEDQLCSGLQ